MDSVWLQAVSTIGLGASMTVYLVLAGRRFVERLMQSAETREGALLAIAQESAKTNALAAGAIRENTAVNRELREAVDNNTRVIGDIVKRLERGEKVRA